MCWLVTAKRVATSLTRSASFRLSKISTSLIALPSSKNRKPHDPSRFGPFSQIRHLTPSPNQSRGRESLFANVNLFLQGRGHVESLFTTLSPNENFRHQVWFSRSRPSCSTASISTAQLSNPILDR